MKANEFIIEASMWSKVEDIADALNDEILKTIKSGMTKQRLTMMTLKDQKVLFSGIKVTEPSSTVWTRGDGSRYKEPGTIGISDASVRAYGREFATFKRLYPTKVAVLDHIWKTLSNAPRAKDIGTVSGQFRADDWAPAITLGGVLWIKRDWSIEYGSPSRLKNKFGVWNHKPPVAKEEVPDKNDLVKVIDDTAITVRGKRKPIGIGAAVHIKSKGYILKFKIKSIDWTTNEITLNDNRIYQPMHLSFAG